MGSSHTTPVGYPVRRPLGSSYLSVVTQQTAEAWPEVRRWDLFLETPSEKAALGITQRRPVESYTDMIIASLPTCV